MKRIISVDGGGLRGVIPACSLVELEKIWSGQPEMWAGNSTGGIIAVGKAAGLSAAELLDFYVKKGPTIFSDPHLALIQPKYDRAKLDAILTQLLRDKKLSDLTGPELFVPATMIDPAVDAFFFKSWRARGLDLDAGERAADWDFYLADIAGATSAAPYYFGDKKIASLAGAVRYMVDGGLHTNSPILAAIDEAETLWPGEDFLVLSLGTGERKKALDGPGAASWGIEWLKHILDIAMTTTSAKDQHIAADAKDAKVIRIQIELPPALTAMDDASKIPDLLALGQQLAADNMDLIEEFAKA